MLLLPVKAALLWALTMQLGFSFPILKMVNVAFWWEQWGDSCFRETCSGFTIHALPEWMSAKSNCIPQELDLLLLTFLEEQTWSRGTCNPHMSWQPGGCCVSPGMTGSHPLLTAVRCIWPLENSCPLKALISRVDCDWRNCCPMLPPGNKGVMKWSLF